MSRFNGKRAEFEASGEKINVAILGAGRIAHTMADTLTQMAEDSLYSSWIHPYAVAARDITRAQAFADQWHFDKAYGSYEELVRTRMWIWCISPPRTVCTPNRRSCV